MARATSPALKAPQTTEAALALAERYAVLDADVQRHTADAQAAIAATKAAAHAVLLPIAAEMKAIEKQLKPWWAARHEELTGGRRRSIELGGCQLGYRLSTPKVCFAGGTDDDAAATLQAAELDMLLRVSVAVDKPAILKAFAGDPDPGEGHHLAARLAGLGFSVQQGDQFFIEPIAGMQVAS